MCGRYQFDLGNDLKSNKLKDKIKEKNISYKEGEIFPGDQVLCIYMQNGSLKLSSMKWGIKTDKGLQINARKESLDKPFYEKIKNNRCVLLANGFYEWDTKKNKYYISFNEPFVYLAAIYDDFYNLLILTRDADDEFKDIHDRFPVILDRNEMNNYLEGKPYSVIREPISITDKG